MTTFTAIIRVSAFEAQSIQFQATSRRAAYRKATQYAERVGLLFVEKIL